MKKTAFLTRLALLSAVAMILSYLESLLPSVGIPGVKLGLANIAVIFALYRLGFLPACAVSLVRVVTVSLLFGSIPSMLYSLAGAALSLTVMSVLRRIDCFSPVGVSIAGGAAHNIGQILMAALILGSNAAFIHLPLLLISGTITGVLIGFAGGALIARTDILK